MFAFCIKWEKTASLLARFKHSILRASGTQEGGETCYYTPHILYIWKILDRNDVFCGRCRFYSMLNKAENPNILAQIKFIY